jgi:ribosomal protein S27E
MNLMRVLTQNETELTLCTGHKSLLLVYGVAGFLVAIGLVFLKAFVDQTLLASSLGMPDWGSILLMPVFPGIFLFAGLLFLINYPAQKSTFDKRSGVATIIERPVWRLCLPRTRTYSLKDVTAITLRQADTVEISLRINLDSGKSVGLTSAPGSKANVSEIAELLSEFMEVPLQINLGLERMIKFPTTWPTNARIEAMNCPKCGGQLPVVTQEMNHVTCEYCGTNMLITWGRGEVPVQVRP